MDQGIELVEITTPTAPGVEVALVAVDQIQHLEEIAEHFLTPPEQARFAALGSPRRRREWLAARVCIKLLAARRGLIGAPQDCRIDQDPRGRPSLVGPSGQAIPGIADCSLSHKGRFACACLGRPPIARVGVDIEAVSPRLRALRDAFTNPSDAIGLQADTDEGLTLLWSLKEAYSKAIGTGLRIGLRNIILNIDSEARSARVRTPTESTAEARHVIYSNCVVAVCFIAQ